MGEYPKENSPRISHFLKRVSFINVILREATIYEDILLAVERHRRGGYPTGCYYAGGGAIRDYFI